MNKAAQSPRKIFLDCDPGVDDAAAIMAAFTAPELEVVGVSSVSGNVPIDLTTSNLAKVLAVVGARNIPFAIGAASPLEREGYFAIEVHGIDGMGGIDLPEPELEPGGIPASDLIYFMAKKHPGDLDLVAIGPLTNIALALEKYPDLVDLVPRLVIMGGGHERFNAGDHAEFNIYADPHAAKIVFDSDLKVEMIGLDVTQEASLSPDFFDGRENLSPKQDLFRRLAYHVEALNRRFGKEKLVNLHDLTTIMYLIRPEIFTMRPARIDVACDEGPDLGRTICRFDMETDQASSDLVALELDHQAYEHLLEEIFQRLA